MFPPSKWGKVIARNEAKVDKAALAKKTEEIIAAMPAADPAEGEPLAKGLCLTCHVINGQGVGFAPPLDGFAARDLDGAITAILNPNAAMENVFRAYQIETKDGVTHEGFKQNETRKEITLLGMGGAPQIYPVKKIKKAGYVEGRSVMPEIAAGLSAKQVASIIAYLRLEDGKSTASN